MNLVKDNRLSSGLLRKKTWCLQLRLNSCQAERLSLIFSWIYAGAPRECTMFSLPQLSPLPERRSQVRNRQPPSPVRPLGGVQSASCDWTDKKVSSATPYSNMVSYKTVWTVFPRCFVFSWITWFTCVFLHFSPHLGGCKERLMFTGVTVSTSEQWWLGTLVL